MTWRIWPDPDRMRMEGRHYRFHSSLREQDTLAAFRLAQLLTNFLVLGIKPQSNGGSGCVI